MSEPTKGKVQGEGDYEAAERYREEVTDFVKNTDISKVAKQAQPASDKESSDMAAAEKVGRSHSKGDDPADVGIMYTKEDKHAKQKP